MKTWISDARFVMLGKQSLTRLNKVILSLNTNVEVRLSKKPKKTKRFSRQVISAH
jgi:hypothetical protein